MIYDKFNDFLLRLENRLGTYLSTSCIAFVLLALAAIYVRPELNYTHAGLWFEQLANNPFEISKDNYIAYRILTPLISYFIGLRGKLFMVTNAIFIFIFINLVYRHFRALYSRPADAFFAAAIMTFSSVVLVTIGYSGFCDILSYVAIFAMWHWRRNIFLYTLFFAAGVFNHENILFLLPWLILIRYSDEESRIKTTVLTVIGLVIVLAGYQIFRGWVASHRDVGLSLSYYVQPLLEDPLHWMRVPVQYYGLGLFTVFKAFWIIPVIACYLLWKEHRKWDIFMTILPVLLASTQLVIAYDTTRMFTLGFMTVVLSLEYLFRTDNREFRKWLPALFVINLFIPQLYTASSVIQNVRSTPMNLLRMWLENKPWWP